MIKKIISLALLLVLISGCVNTSTNDNTSHIRFGAFSNETYIWESWSTTTNTVNQVK